MDGCAKLMDLEDFVLTDTFVEAQENAKAVAKNIQVDFFKFIGCKIYIKD